MWEIALAAFASALAAVLMVAVHPLAPIAAGIMLAIGVFLASSPFYLLLTFVTVLYVRPAELVPALGVLKLGKLSMASALGLWILGKFVKRDLTYARTPLNGLMVWLTAAVVLSSVFGAWPSESVRMFIEVFVKIILVYVLIVNLCDSPRRLIALQVLLGCLTAFLGGYAMWMKSQGLNLVEGSRASGIGMIGDPNDLALTLLTSTCFLLLAVMQVKGRLRAFFLLLLVLNAGGIIATQSRGGMLAMCVGLFLVLQHRIRNKAMLLAISGVAAAILFVAGGVGARKGLDGRGLDESAEGRLAAWRAGMRMLISNPAIGVGFEQFPGQFFYHADSFPTGNTVMAAHNSYVKALAEVGLLGAIPFFGLVFVALWSAWRVAAMARSRIPPGLEAAAVASVVGNLGAVAAAAFFLSQTWMWFIYILFAQAAAARRIYGIDRTLTDAVFGGRNPEPGTYAGAA